MERFDIKSLDKFFKVVLSLDNLEDCYMFFEDICTVKELKDIEQRLDVALMLSDGKNYIDISSEVGVSSTTISRVNRCLMYGTGGYELAIDRIKGDEDYD